MKKILIAFDGGFFSKGAVEFANKLNERNTVLLVGVFLAHVDYANLLSYWGGGTAGPLLIPIAEGEDSETVQTNVRQFESYCVKNGIEYRVHRDFNDFALPELKKETRFADLLIINGENFYKTPGTNNLSEYLKEALHEVECSVVVVPGESGFPETNILAYDGSAQSVFAIKQFAYLFPELSNNETILIYVNEKEKESLPDEMNIEELAARHYNNLVISKVNANPKEFFHTWLLERKNSILVSGAFGRSGFSRIFHKSFAADIIKDHKIPVFISHGL